MNGDTGPARPLLLQRSWLCVCMCEWRGCVQKSVSDTLLGGSPLASPEPPPATLSKPAPSVGPTELTGTWVVGSPVLAVPLARQLLLESVWASPPPAGLPRLFSHPSPSLATHLALYILCITVTEPLDVGSLIFPFYKCDS